MLTTAEVQSAIANEVRTSLHQQGKVVTVASDGTEFTFRMDDSGAIGVFLVDENGEEQEFCFRLEIVED